MGYSSVLSFDDQQWKIYETVLNCDLFAVQVYDWMVQNIDYFKDKGDSNSSAGWKVSRQTFIRISRLIKS